MSQRTLSSLSKTVSRLSNIDQKIWSAVDNPLHGQTDVYNVFVFCQHQCLMAMRLDLSDVHDVYLIDQRWIPVQPWTHFVLQHFTKAEYDTALLLIHLVNTGKGVKAQSQKHKQTDPAT